MAGLHHMVLKAAIAKYAPLVLEAENANQIKDEIRKDEKGFDEDAVNEIYAALTKRNDLDSEGHQSQGGKLDEGSQDPELEESASEGDDESADEDIQTSDAPAYEVIVKFRDINNMSIEYTPGNDVSHFEKERLDWLIAHGHVVKND